MSRDGEIKWESKTFTKGQLESIIGSFDSTPTDQLISAIAGLVTSLGILSIGQAAYAIKYKAKFQDMLAKAKGSSSIVIQTEYRYISQGKNKQGWIPTGNYRY